MTFESLGLAPALLRALSEQNYINPTPIQAEAIPLALAGHDLLGGAQTGTGKTAAFGLPLLHRLATTQGNTQRKPRVLILAPTRELALQVSDSLRGYAKYLRLNVHAIFGGAGMGPQLDALRRGVDVLVATPGRLIDHLERGSAKLDAVEMLVMDEADRMLDMGFLPAIKRILGRLPPQRQTLLFSATFETQIKQLALEFMRSPQQVQIASNSIVADAITHRVHPVDGGRKRDLLIQILASRPNDQVIVFGRTKHGCNRLSEQLEEAGLKSVAIHGNKSQAQRQKALRDFKANKARVLVATDVAARGLDIPSLPLVINFDLPMVAEDYVHRIGRTGRNGLTGEALSLVSPDEGGLLRQIQRILKDDIEMVTVAGFEPSRPIRMGSDAPGARRPGAPGGNNRGNNAPRKPAHRPHGKPAPRHAHAGPKQHRGGGAGAGAGAQQGQRRDRSAG
ncbi:MULTISPECIES: DEAD/DEAH box helicase [Lysobacter]|jgi:ATP-dependent RNA helicase RhlE|uniref:DEAD/DEAH box helicase n=1 Tax=Lysobacter TaxID=68 RepID=UPI001F38A24A|nr:MULTISPECIES: DEAD/DEAH box helicase [Lysobacter]UJB20732.1 DEAD/DEAH box helicase [Lysobacter capsici]UJQ30154.1 DEAD/DEAH box helicase [Lysobacter gummosus]